MFFRVIFLGDGGGGRGVCLLIVKLNKGQSSVLVNQSNALSAGISHLYFIHDIFFKADPVAIGILARQKTGLVAASQHPHWLISHEKHEKRRNVGSKCGLSNYSYGQKMRDHGTNSKCISRHHVLVLAVHQIPLLGRIKPTKKNKKTWASTS